MQVKDTKMPGHKAELQAILDEEQIVFDEPKTSLRSTNSDELAEVEEGEHNVYLKQGMPGYTT